MFGIFKNKTAPASTAQAAAKNYSVTAEDVMVFEYGRASKAGVTVTRESAMQSSAVYACVRLLSETIASLPFNVHGGTENPEGIDKDNPLHILLHSQPNEMMSAFTWLELVVAHALYEGNHYSRIVENGRGDVVALLPLLPGQVQPFKHNAKLYYSVTNPDGSKEILLDYQVFHVPGHGFDGVKGYSAIQHYAREVIGLSLATQEHGARLFSNGTNLGGLLQTEHKIEADRQRALVKQFNEQFRGIQNAQKTAILTDGLKFEKVGMTSEDAQFLESRKFQVTEIARIFGVPPHMIGDLERATFSNIEHQNINYAMFSIRPWCKRIEGEANRKLCHRPYYARFNLDGLLRADFKSRMEGYSKGLSIGLMTPNEARALENLPPVEGGDILRVPVNTQPITAESNSPEGE